MSKGSALALAFILPVILSFGAVNALIPIIVVLILIAAAAGMNRGYSIFNIFGVATLAGISPGSSKSSIAGKSGFPVLMTFFGTVGKTSAGKRVYGRIKGRVQRSIKPIANTMIASRLARRAMKAPSGGGIPHAPVAGATPKLAGRAVMQIKKAGKLAAETKFGGAVSARVATRRGVIATTRFKNSLKEKVGAVPGVKRVGEAMGKTSEGISKASTRAKELAAHPDTRKWLRRAKKAGVYTLAAGTGLGALGYVAYRTGGRLQHLGKPIKNETKPTFRPGSGGKNVMGVARDERREARAARDEKLIKTNTRAKESSETISRISRESKMALQEAQKSINKHVRAGRYDEADKIARDTAKTINANAKRAKLEAEHFASEAGNVGAHNTKRIAEKSISRSNGEFDRLDSVLGRPMAKSNDRRDVLAAAGLAVGATARLARSTNPSRNYKEAAEEHRTTKMAYLKNERQPKIDAMKGEAKRVGKGVSILLSPGGFLAVNRAQKYRERRDKLREHVVGSDYSAARAAGRKYVEEERSRIATQRSEKIAKGENPQDVRGISRREVRKAIQAQMPGESAASQKLFGRPGNRFREGRIKEVLIPSQKPPSRSLPGAAAAGAASTVRAAYHGYKGSKTQLEEREGGRVGRTEVITGPGGFGAMRAALKESAKSGLYGAGKNQNSPETARALRSAFDMVLAGGAETKRLIHGTPEKREELKEARSNMLKAQKEYLTASKDDREDRREKLKEARDKYSQVRMEVKAQPSKYKPVEEAMNRFKWSNIKNAKDPRLIDAYLAASAEVVRSEKINQKNIYNNLDKALKDREKSQMDLIAYNTKEAKAQNDLKQINSSIKEAKQKKDTATVAAKDKEAEDKEKEIKKIKSDITEKAAEFKAYAAQVRAYQLNLDRSIERSQMHLSTKITLADTKAGVLSPEPELKLKYKEGTTGIHTEGTIEGAIAARETLKKKLADQAEEEGYSKDEMKEISQRQKNANDEFEKAVEDRQAMYKTVQSAKAGKDEDELIEKRREEAEVKAREEAFRERATAAGKIAGVANKAQSGPEELAKRFAQNANDSEIGEYLNSKDANLVDAALESKTLTYPKPARDHLDRLLDLASDDDPNNIKRAHRAIDLITLHLKKGTFDAQEDEEIRRRIGDKLKFGERFGDKYAGKK